MSVHAHMNSIPDLVLMRNPWLLLMMEKKLCKASDLNFTFSPLLQFSEREAFWPCGMDCRWRCGLFHRSWVCWASFSLSGAGENPKKRDWRITLQLKSYEMGPKSLGLSFWWRICWNSFQNLGPIWENCFKNLGKSGYIQTSVVIWLFFM